MKFQLSLLIVSALPLLYQAFTAIAPNASSGTAFASKQLSRLEVAQISQPSGTSSSDDTTKIGVLLLNLGGPETLDEVEGFLYNLFADPDIIRLPNLLSPLQSTLAYFISRSRAPKSREAYESIGGGSPILKYSTQQGERVEEILKEKYDLDAKCYVAMRYWKPYTQDALKQLKDDGVNALVILPLYPQFSISTSGSSLRVLQEEFASNQHLYGNIQHTVVASWFDRPGYVNSMAQLITQELNSFSTEELEQGSKHVLFSAHGVPKSYIQSGDPYQRQIEECVNLISKQLPEDATVHLSYQSRVGPIEWLRPYTDDMLPKLGQEGVKNLVVVPISFVSEHIETLEEIDMEYKELALESGITNWKRCPALNLDETFLEDMADMVVDALCEPVQTVTEACVANNCLEVEQQSFSDKMGLSRSSNKVKNTNALAELWNGRLAMAGVGGTLLVELLTGKSPLLRFFGL